jgi:hypothetical protein
MRPEHTSNFAIIFCRDLQKSLFSLKPEWTFEYVGRIKLVHEIGFRTGLPDGLFSNQKFQFG